MKAFAIGVKIKGVDEVSGVFKGVSRNLASFQNQVVKSNGAITSYLAKTKAAASGMMGPMSNVFGMLAGYLTAGAIIDFSKKSIDAWNESAAALANVEAGLKSTKSAAGLTSQALQDMSVGLQAVTTFDDDAILQNVSAQLLTFGNIGKENFNRVQKAIIDVTAKLKGLNATGDDLKSVSIMMGKAMEDPVRGLTAMRRVGISFSDAEKDMITAMVDAGDTLGAQNAMLKIIERQYGGTAEAIGKTNGGLELMRKNRIGNMMEELGAILAPLRMQFIQLAVDALPKITQAVKWLGENKDLIINLVGALGTFLVTQLLVNKALLAYTVIQKGMMLLGGFIALVKTVTATTKGWAAVQAILNAVMSANPIGIIVIAIAALAAGAFLVVKNWKAISTFFVNLWGTVVGAFKKAFNFIWGLLDNKWLQTALAIFMPIVGIPVMIIKNWGGISEFFVNLWASITEGAGVFFEWFSGVWEGVTGQFKAAVEKIKGFFTGLWDGIKQGWTKFLSGLPEPVKAIFGIKTETKTGANNQNASFGPAARNQMVTKNLNSSKTEKQQVTVEFKNAPKGTRMDTSKSKPGLDLSMGYANAGL